MANMPNISVLVAETITHILIYTDISVKDVLNFGLTCKKFYDIINKDNKLWREKYFQSDRRLEWLRTAHDGQNVKYKLELKIKMNCRKTLHNFIELKYENYWHINDLTFFDMDDFSNLICEDKDTQPSMHYYFLSALTHIINTYPVDSTLLTYNLTHYYYAEKLFYYMTYFGMRDKWQIFITLPAGEQVLDRAFYIFLIMHKNIKRIWEPAMNDIALQVFERFKHLPQISIHNFDYGKDHNIDTNKCNSETAKYILHTIYDYIHGSVLLNVALSEETEIINFICSITFHVVARRLGVRCDLLYSSSSSELFLIWKEDYTEDSNYLYKIDVLSEPFNLERLQFPRVLNDVEFSLEEYMTTFRITYESFIKIYISISEDTWRGTEEEFSILHFLHTLSPRDAQPILKLSKYYLTRDVMNWNPIIEILSAALSEENLNVQMTEDERDEMRRVLEQISSKSQVPPETPKLRINCIPYEPKYAIGMIVKFHVPRIEYIMIGVIYGWDPLHRDKYKWNSNNQIELIPSCITQYSDTPYYKILALDGECYYIPECNITAERLTTIIEHDSIGRFFPYYREDHYEPGRMLNRLYPDDKEVRERFLDTLYRSSIQI